MVDPNDLPESYFGRWRVVCGLVLVAVAAFLCIWDALHSDYAIEPGILGFLIGGGGAFLGVEWLGKLAARLLK